MMMARFRVLKNRTSCHALDASQASEGCTHRKLAPPMRHRGMLICINPAVPAEINLVLTDLAAVVLRHVRERSLLHNQKHVFVVDDDPGMLRAMDRLLRRHGYDTVLFESAEAFENHSELDKALCLCILLDINLNNGRSGIELRKHLKEAGHSVPVIYMTGK